MLDLKDGTTQAGQVVELGGNSVEIVLPAGSKKVQKSEIAKATFDATRQAKEIQDMDVVIRQGGHKIRGIVEILDGGRKVAITLPSGARALLNRSDVVRIIRKGEATEHTTTVYTAELAKAIDGAIGTLRSDAVPASKDASLSAERFLASCGIFAIYKVRETLKSQDPQSEAGKAFRRIDRLYRLKEVMATPVEETEGRVYEILTEGTTREKCDLLLLIFPRFVDECVPLAQSLAGDALQDAVVRAWAVDFLGRMQRNKELLAIYRESVGEVQLASALALGRNRVLIGIPTLLEALEMDSVELRDLAHRHLREFTGQDFGFRAQGAPEARKQALQSWRSWWQQNAASITKSAEDIILEKTAETPERLAAVQLWKEASQDLEEKKLPQAEMRLRRAVKTDPTFFQGIICLAALLYTDLQKPDEALKIMTDLRARSIPGMAPQDRQWIHLYLGHASRATGDLEGAVAAYRQCHLLAPDNLDAALSLGDAAFELATSEKDIKPDERKKGLQGAVDAYEQASVLLENLMDGLTTLKLEQMPAQVSLPIDRRQYNRTVLELRGRYRLQRIGSLFQMGKIRALLGEKEEALLIWRKAAEESAQEDGAEDKTLQIKIRASLGLLYEEMGKSMLALKEYRKILDGLDPQHAESRQGVERLRRQVEKKGGG